eukprot:comp23090_c1_seq1/m.37081 comp23090_c1_seq1/g.37081  ORF comp23090_c1_seq1/g.37081 comp23090_c1_seq1/m.37081 type:complete len:604 (-) comp23090_c1_seq1:98-1909(-)
MYMSPTDQLKMGHPEFGSRLVRGRGTVAAFVCAVVFGMALSHTLLFMFSTENKACTAIRVTTSPQNGTELSNEPLDPPPIVLPEGAEPPRPINPPPQWIDDTSAQRCDYISARNSGEHTKRMMSSAVIKDDPDRPGHRIVTLYTSGDGGRRRHGGDNFLGYMYRFTNGDGKGLYPKEKFDLYSGSIDNCDGSYTFHFDMEVAPAGRYSFAAIQLAEGYMHEASPLIAPDCGARIGDFVLSAESYINEGQFEAGKIFFPSLSVWQNVPGPLHTFHLPHCTFNHSSHGRWVFYYTCVGAEFPCRQGPEHMHTLDAYIWVPYECSLKYVEPEKFSEKLHEKGIKSVAFLGDSRSYNLFLAFNDYMRGVMQDASTGSIRVGDLARSELGIQYEKPAKLQGVDLEHMTFTQNNITFLMVESYGTHPRFDRFGCAHTEPRDMVDQDGYLALRKQMGTFFEKLEALSRVPEKPDMLIVQDGGLHEMFASIPDTYFERSLHNIALEMKAKFGDKRVIFMTMPAAHVQDIDRGFSVRSLPRQQRRSKIAKSIFGSYGYEVWDTFPMTVTRGDRYYDKLHFYPQAWYPHKANSFPKLLNDELVQDLINRMYKW